MFENSAQRFSEAVKNRIFRGKHQFPEALAAHVDF
jgi:hypothetical protein